MPRYDENGNVIAERPALTTQPSVLDRAAREPRAIYDRVVGAAKGLGRSVVGAGEMVAGFPYVLGDGNNVGGVIDAMFSVPGYPTRTLASLAALKNDPLLVAQNPTQEQAMSAERVGEFLLLPSGKGRVLAKIAQNALGAASLTGIQGGSAQDMATAGAVGAAVPAVASAVGTVAKNQAVPLVRSGLKPTLTAIKGEKGANEGLNAAANRIARYIVDRRILSVKDASNLVHKAERSVRDAVTRAGDPITDAAQQADIYLRTLLADVSKADEPALTNIVRREIHNLYRKGGKFSRTEPVIDPLTGMAAVDANGNVITQQVLRMDIPATEARTLAQKSSKYVTQDTWGDKGRAMHQRAKKAKESGVRASVRDAVPDARPGLLEQSRAIPAREIMDRMGFRQGNNNAVSLPAHVVAAGEIAKGKIPLLSWVANALNKNQLRLGVYSDVVGTALKNNDSSGVVSLLGKAGMSLPSLVGQGVVVDLDQPEGDGEWERQPNGKWRFIK